MRADWIGTPAGSPAIATRARGGDSVDVYASWNGATLIRHWQILAGDDPDELALVGSPSPFVDLETRMRVQTRRSFVAVEALDAQGGMLGRSEAARVR